MATYIGPQPVPQSTQHRESFTATSGQTSFATAGYTPQFLDVYLNGVHLLDGTDFTATNGSDVVLTTGAASGDTLEVVAYTAFEAANVTGATDFTVTGSFTSRGIDDNATSTAMTLDGSGNLLVGATSLPANSTATGVGIRGAGDIFANRSGDAAGIFNRINNDGDIVKFQKNGTTVGSISAFNGDKIVIGTGAVGIGFAVGDGLLPWNTTTNTPSDNSFGLGNPDYRFKDLYLSGGVYLGGTGAANKLEDYEEGTWTVTMEPSAGFTATNNTSTGYYTKIGNVVTVSGIAQMTTPASLGTWSNDNINFALLVSGLPFNVGSALQRRSAPVLGVVSTIGWSSGNVLMGHGDSSGDEFQVYQCKANGALRASPNLATSSSHSFHFGFTYTTD